MRLRLVGQATDVDDWSSNRSRGKVFHSLPPRMHNLRICSYSACSSQLREAVVASSEMKSRLSSSLHLSCHMKATWAQGRSSTGLMGVQGGLRCERPRCSGSAPLGPRTAVCSSTLIDSRCRMLKMRAHGTVKAILW